MYFLFPNGWNLIQNNEHIFYYPPPPGILILPESSFRNTAALVFPDCCDFRSSFTDCNSPQAAVTSEAHMRQLQKLSMDLEHKGKIRRAGGGMELRKVMKTLCFREMSPESRRTEMEVNVTETHNRPRLSTLKNNNLGSQDGWERQTNSHVAEPVKKTDSSSLSLYLHWLILCSQVGSRHGIKFSCHYMEPRVLLLPHYGIALLRVCLRVCEGNSHTVCASAPDQSVFDPIMPSDHPLTLSSVSSRAELCTLTPTHKHLPVRHAHTQTQTGHFFPTPLSVTRPLSPCGLCSLRSEKQLSFCPPAPPLITSPPCGLPRVFSQSIAPYRRCMQTWKAINCVSVLLQNIHSVGVSGCTFIIRTSRCWKKTSCCVASWGQMKLS